MIYFKWFDQIKAQFNLFRHNQKIRRGFVSDLHLKFKEITKKFQNFAPGQFNRISLDPTSLMQIEGICYSVNLNLTVITLAWGNNVLT